MEQALAPTPLAALGEPTAERAAARPVATAPADADALPAPSAVGQAVLGFALLGCVAALGTAGMEGATRVLPAAIVVDLGALVMTGPALVVAHQVLGLEAPAPAIVARLANAFCRAGTVALGLCPALLFFAATSGLATGLFVLALLGIAVFALHDAYTGLVDAEGGAGAATDRTLRRAKMHVLSVGWMVLTALVGLRLGLHLAGV